MAFFPDVTVVLHAINTEVHETIPPGWRWCVQLGGAPYADRKRKLNAGWCPSYQEAAMVGEAVGIAVAKALRKFRFPVTCTTVELDYDPIVGGLQRAVYDFRSRNDDHRSMVELKQP